MLRISTITIAVLASLVAPAVAGAAANQIRGDIVVRYSDLNLSKERDARQMLERLSEAARQACGGSPFIRDHSPSSGPFVEADHRKCHRAALGQAVASLRAPLVTRLYAESFQGPSRFAQR